MKSVFLILAGICLCHATFHKKADEVIDHSHNKGFLQENENDQVSSN